MFVGWGPHTSSYIELFLLRTRLQDAVILAVDFEAQLAGRELEVGLVESVTQMGTASLDMRELGKGITNTTPEEIAAKIQATHDLVDHSDWQNVRVSSRNFTSMFNSVFCRSEVMDTADQMLEKAKHRILALKTDNRRMPSPRASPGSKASSGSKASPGLNESPGPSQPSNEETEQEPDEAPFSVGAFISRLKAAGEWGTHPTPLIRPTPPKRDVYVLFWGSGLEERIFGNSRHNPFNEGGFILWDIQQWLPIRSHHRVRAGERCPCWKFVSDVGLHGLTNKLHNAANDSWAVLMGFVQILRMDEEAFEEYCAGVGPGGGVADLGLSWVDKSILEDNGRLGYLEDNNPREMEEELEFRGPN